MKTTTTTITKLLLFFIVLLSNFSAFSQSRRVADRYFDEFAYVKAAKLYESIYQKGDSSSYVLKRLGDSYYNNAETKNAEKWYKILVENNTDIENDYLFKYAQVLRSNGAYKKSDSLFVKLSGDNSLNIDKEGFKDQKYLLDFTSNKKRISIRNLAINTEFSDFGGFIINERETYFASASPKSLKKEKLYKWNNQPFLNIYKSNSYNKLVDESEKDSVLELEYKRLLPAPVNTQYHESTPVFTKDLNTMYFTRVNYDGKKLRTDKEETINLKLYRADKEDDKWVNITELPFNSNEYSVGHPALSPDDKILYFVSDMPGGIGKTDIYKVNINEDNYSEPINLGKTINTFDREMFPFVGDDNTLYFSSNGHLGLGLLDVFQSKIKENNTYDKPVNLGHPFNSKRDDFSFYIDAKGEKGFVSSNRDGGKGDDDIYSFVISQDVVVEPEICNQAIAGIVRSSHDNSPIPYATVKIVNDKGEVVSEVATRKDGSYDFRELPCVSEKYTINGSKLDFKPDTKIKSTTGVKNSITQVDLVLTPLIIGNQIVISPIYFDFDKSNIREDAQYELENIVTVMNNHPDMIIKIESHTDSRGNREYNRSLSDRRAKSTRDYILSRGFAKNRIESAKGFGEANLLNHCDDANRNKCTEEEHQLNRRSYFYIVKGGDDVDIINKKPSTIDHRALRYNKKDSVKKLKIKNKILIEKLNQFRRNRALKKDSDKCTRDDDCK